MEPTREPDASVSYMLPAPQPRLIMLVRRFGVLALGLLALGMGIDEVIVNGTGWQHAGGEMEILFGLALVFTSILWWTRFGKRHRVGMFVLSCVLALPICGLLMNLLIPLHERRVYVAFRPPLNSVAGRYITDDPRAPSAVIGLQSDGTYSLSGFPSLSEPGWSIPPAAGQWAITELQGLYRLDLGSTKSCMLRKSGTSYELEFYLGDPDEGDVRFRRE